MLLESLPQSGQSSLRFSGQRCALSYPLSQTGQARGLGAVDRYDIVVSASPLVTRSFSSPSTPDNLRGTFIPIGGVNRNKCTLQYSQRMEAWVTVLVSVSCIYGRGTIRDFRY
jgi:hypothetical protein